MTPTPPTDTPAPNSARAALVAQAQADGDYGMTPTPAAVAAAREIDLDFSAMLRHEEEAAIMRAAEIIERETRVGALRDLAERVAQEQTCHCKSRSRLRLRLPCIRCHARAALSAAPAAGEEGK